MSDPDPPRDRTSGNRAWLALVAAVVVGTFTIQGCAAWAQEPASPGPSSPPGAAPSAEPRTKATADLKGYPLTDPSENVRAVLEAGMKALADVMGKEVKRADDLRSSIEKFTQSEIKRIDEVAALRAHYDAKISELTNAYNTKMSDAESKRIDALRASDAAATKEASTLALTSIKDITAQAFTASKDATAKQESAADKRFDQLKSELSVQFKSQDEKLTLLTNQNSTMSGRDAGVGTMIAGAGLVVGLLIALATLAFNVMRRPHPPTTDPLLVDLLRELTRYRPPNGYPPSNGYPPRNGASTAV